ncbi:MAG: ATP-binding protein [Sphaerochaeta sp.]|nr:ATP-binding protein [Sphaerochaeta sp.]
MEAIELLEILANGEDSKYQFKRNITNPDSLAQEMIAFSNGDGGMIAIGVDDDGTIHGLSDEDIRRLNQMVSNSASEKVRPAINPKTENISTEDKLVMVITVHAGVNK